MVCIYVKNLMARHSSSPPSDKLSLGQTLNHLQSLSSLHSQTIVESCKKMSGVRRVGYVWAFFPEV